MDGKQYSSQYWFVYTRRRETVVKDKNSIKKMQDVRMHHKSPVFDVCFTSLCQEIRMLEVIVWLKNSNICLCLIIK